MKKDMTAEEARNVSGINKLTELEYCMDEITEAAKEGQPDVWLGDISKDVRSQLKSKGYKVSYHPSEVFGTAYIVSWAT
jgi:hypothetical protein